MIQEYEDDYFLEEDKMWVECWMIPIGKILFFSYVN